MQAVSSDRFTIDGELSRVRLRNFISSDLQIYTVRLYKLHKDGTSLQLKLNIGLGREENVHYVLKV